MSKRNPMSPEEKERRRARKARADKKKAKRGQAKNRERGRRYRNVDEDVLQATGLTEDKYDEVKWALEAAFDSGANLDSAAGESYVGDQDQITAEEEGFQDDTLTKIASVGTAVAVNSDVLVPPGLYETLKLEPNAHAQLWNEAFHKVPKSGHVYSADEMLVRWMREHGFERVGVLEGRLISDSSMELGLDNLYDTVARLETVSPDVVQAVAEAEFGDSMSSNKELIYWQPSNGDVEAYALPEGAERVENPWIDDPMWATSAGAFLGSLAGIIPGAIVKSGPLMGIGSLAGGAAGGYMGAPGDRKSRGAWGGGIGGGLGGPVGAGIGGLVGGRKPGKKRKNNPTNELKRKLLR